MAYRYMGIFGFGLSCETMGSSLRKMIVYRGLRP